MEFVDYQNKSKKSAIYPDKGHNFIYPVIGLAGETGEVAEKIKKIIRDKGSIVSNDDRQEISKEIGDVLWYLSQLASELDLDFNDIAQENLDKIASRMKREKLFGSGDNR